MSLFKDTNHMYVFLEDLWKYIVFDAGLGEKMKEYDVSIKYIISEPDGYLFVDPENVITGEEANKMRLLPWNFPAIPLLNSGQSRYRSPLPWQPAKLNLRDRFPKC